LSHSSRGHCQAVAVKAWLIEHEPGWPRRSFWIWTRTLASGPGSGGGGALQQANARCEALICLLSKHWESSRECQTYFRYAESLGKTILCARLEPVPDTNITSEWQRCDLFPDHGSATDVDIADGGEPVVLDAVGLQRAAGGVAGVGHRGRAFPVAAAGRPGPRAVSGVVTVGGS